MSLRAAVAPHLVAILQKLGRIGQIALVGEQHDGNRRVVGRQRHFGVNVGLRRARERQMTLRDARASRNGDVRRKVAATHFPFGNSFKRANACHVKHNHGANSLCVHVRR